MTAADKFALDAIKATVVAHTAKIATVIAIIGTLTLTYCAGKSTGQSEERSRMADSVRHVLADSSRRIETRIEHRTDTLKIVQRVATQERHDAHQAIQDVQRVIDSVPHADSLPVSLVVPAIQTCARALVADSIEVNVMAAQIDDLTKDRDVWRSRALMDEKQSHSRFGLKTGVAIGATVVAVIVKVLR